MGSSRKSHPNFSIIRQASELIAFNALGRNLFPFFLRQFNTITHCSSFLVKEVNFNPSKRVVYKRRVNFDDELVTSFKSITILF